MCVSQLDTVVGLFCRTTNARLGKGKTASCNLELNEARREDLGVLSITAIF